jgi:hypothetical protein
VTQTVSGPPPALLPATSTRKWTSWTANEMLFSLSTILAPDVSTHPDVALCLSDSACTNLGSNADTVKSAYSVQLTEPTDSTSRDSTRGDDFIPLFSASSSHHAPTSANAVPPSRVPVFLRYPGSSARRALWKKYKPVAQKIRPVLGSLP